MLKYTRSAIGLLTRLYRSVLQKCWLINIGVWALGAVGKTVSTLLPQTLRGTLSPESTNELEKLLQTALMSGDVRIKIEDTITGLSIRQIFKTSLITTTALTMSLVGAVTFAGALVSPSAARASDIYTTTKSDSSDYTYSVYGQDGQMHYYKIELNPDKMSTQDSIVWTKSGAAAADTTWNATDKQATGTVEIALPQNGSSESSYYTYTYTVPSGYTQNKLTNGYYVNRHEYESYDESGDSDAYGLNVDSNMVADFINNYVESYAYGTDPDAHSYGGAVHLTGSFSSIVGNYIGNYTVANAENSEDGSTWTYGYGGAIYNEAYGVSTTLTGDFIGNHAITEGGAVYGGKYGNIAGNFIGNYASSGGAISSINSADSITGNFIGNFTVKGSGGAINGNSITSITGDFIGNHAGQRGGAINTTVKPSTTMTITGDFIGNYVDGTTSTYYNYDDTVGGAIYVGISSGTNTTLDLNDSSFIGNYIRTFAGTDVQYNNGFTTAGAAIALAVSNKTATVNLNAQNKDIIFYNNRLIDTKRNLVTYDDISLINNSSGNNYTATWNLNAATDKNIVFGGKISGFAYDNGKYADQSVININADSNIYGGNYQFNNEVSYAKINFGSSTTSSRPLTVKLGSVLQTNGTTTHGSLNRVNFVNNVTEAVLDTQNNFIDKQQLLGLTLNQPLKLAIDASLDKYGVDTIEMVDHIAATAPANSLVIDAIDLGSLADEYNIQITDDPVLKTAYTLSDDIMSNITGASAANIASVSYDNTTGYLTFRTMTPTTPDNISPEAETVDYSAKAPDLSGITDGSGSSGGYLNPTLSYIKSHTVEGSESAEGTAHYANLSSGEHAQYELSTTQGENTHSVYIDGTQYWYTPNESGDDAAVKNAELINLLSTGTVALTEVADSTGNWVVHAGDKYYAYDATKLPESVYNVKKAEASDYTFSAGDKYYKVALDTAKMGSNPTASHAHSWTLNSTATAEAATSFDTSTKVATGRIGVTLPKGDTTETKYYDYSYTSPSGYAVTTTRQTSMTDANSDGIADNFDKKVYKVIYKYNNGGALYKSGGSVAYEIIADFIGNSLTAQSSNGDGGAIYNTSSTIGNITGDFIENSLTTTSSNYYGFGGAIANYSTSTIGNITGDFIGNSITTKYSGGSGGAIYNTSSTIGNITGDFIGNSLTASSYGKGGAIYNSTTGIIGNITGDFIRNSISSSSGYGQGGAIFNQSTSIIGNITGDFIGNSITTMSSSSRGGAIYNQSSSTIGNITGDFIGNSIHTIGSSSHAYGGAIYVEQANTGTITGNFIGNSATSATFKAYGGAIANEYSTISLANSSFINNSVSGNADSNGGAIYNMYYGSNDATLNISALDKDILFYNNSVTADAVKSYNDIYQGSDFTSTSKTGIINLNAAEGRKISFGGTIDGFSGRASQQILNLNTDSTNYGGTYEFNNAVMNHTINLGSSTANSHPVTMRLGGIIQANGSPTYGSLDNTDTLVNYANNSILDTRNANMDDNVVNTLDLQNNTLHWMLDASLFGGSDTLNATSVTDGVLNLNTINLGNIAKKVDVKLTDNAELAQNIDLPSNYLLEGSMARFVESVSYNKDNGILTFTTKTPSGDDSGVASPYIKVNPVEKTGTSAWKDDDGASWVDREPVAAEAYGYGDIAIGDNAKAGISNTTKDDYNRSYATAIGYNAQATGTNSTALGHGAVAYAQGSVALGLGSITGSATEGDQKNTDDAYVISVGSGNADDASTYQYRRIINVKEGEGDNDAATVGQLRAATAFDENITQNGTKAVTSGTIAQHLSNNYSRKLTKINTFCDGLDGKIEPDYEGKIKADLEDKITPDFEGKTKADLEDKIKPNFEGKINESPLDLAQIVKGSTDSKASAQSASIVGVRIGGTPDGLYDNLIKKAEDPLTHSPFGSARDDNITFAAANDNTNYKHGITMNNEANTFSETTENVPASEMHKIRQSRGISSFFRRNNEDMMEKISQSAANTQKINTTTIRAA